MPIKTQDDPLYTTKQAAEYINNEPTTLEVWRSTKRYPLEYVKLGRSVRYRKSALDRFIDARTVKAVAA